MSLLEEAIAAHGGMERWQQIDSLQVQLDCSGLALRMKGHADSLRDLTALVDVRRPQVRFSGLGTFDGAEPRPRGMARRLRWSREELVHFAGYALWNYLTAPFLFAGDGFEVEELPRRRLRVRFPTGVPTHSREQVFHFRPDGLLSRLDYTAEVFGPWARAAHRCLEYAEFGGIVFPTRRRVVPRGLPGPTLIAIAIAAVETQDRLTHPAVRPSLSSPPGSGDVDS